MWFTCVKIYFSLTSFFGRIEGLHGLDDLVDVAEVELVRNLGLEIVVVDAFFGVKTVFLANTIVSVSNFFFG